MKLGTDIPNNFYIYAPKLQRVISRQKPMWHLTQTKN